MEALISIKQTSTVELYKTQFEMLLNRVRGLSDSHRLNCFLGGLKEEMRVGVGMLNPQNIVAAYWLAKMQEENLKIMETRFYGVSRLKPNTNLAQGGK
jgi:hypothetical protein